MLVFFNFVFTTVFNQGIKRLLETKLEGERHEQIWQVGQFCWLSCSLCAGPFGLQQ